MWRKGKNDPRVRFLCLRGKMNSGASKGRKVEGDRLT
jgi:hypothetical protein